MDVELVAAATSALLAQGFLAEAGKSAWQGTNGLLEAVRKRFRGERQLESALENLEGDPHSDEAAARVTNWIASAMLHDAIFFETLKEFVTQASNSPSTSMTIARIHNDYRNAKIGKVVNIETVRGGGHPAMGLCR